MNNNSTFREQVLEFWRWFPTVADELAEQIESGKGLEGLSFDFVEEVRDKVGGLSWVFGPGESEGRISFTLSGEGQKARQLLTRYWLSQAVEIPGWDFFASRQPTSADQLANIAIDVGGNKVDAETLMIATEVDEESNAVDIKAWHETFEHLPDDARFQILYLLLDEALGEFGTQTKLGNMQFKEDASARPLAELPTFLEELWAEKDWEDCSPLESYAGYRSEPGEGFARADTIAGYTCVPEVVLGFLNNDGALEHDPIEDTGAELLYIQIKADVFDSENPLEERTEVEEEVARRIAGAGYLVGGATGAEHMYIDLVHFDGKRSLAAIEEALSVKELDGQYEIKPFAGG